MAKGDILFRILGTMGDMTVSSFDLFNAFLNAGYGASAGKINYELSKIERKRIKHEEEKELKQKYYNLLYKLEEDGLIKVEIKNKSRLFSLTADGKRKLDKLKIKIDDRLPSPAGYNGEKGNLAIVVFDIPEKERRKRGWIRDVLKNIGLRMIQKSVWVGKVKIPEEFLKDLFRLKIIDFVEIFEINKTGSLKQIN